MRRTALATIIVLFALVTIVVSRPQEKEPQPSLPATLPQALWNSTGLQINNSSGNTPQQNPATCLAGDGSLFVVWEDGRSGFTKLFAQKYDPSGNPLWGINGLKVGDGEGNQNSARLACDGSGGLVIAWQDYRNDNSDIFAQHLSPGGTTLWGTGALPICVSAYGQFAPEIALNQKGDIAIVWHDYRNCIGEDVYAQKVDRQGRAQWAANGIALCDEGGTQWYPQIASDGTDGFFVVWTDGRPQNNGSDIYGQHLSSNGEGLWGKNGLALCAAANNQENPVLAANKNVFFLAWTDLRSNNKDIYAQKFNLAGAPLWEKNGLRVTNDQFSQENPDLSPAPDGGAVIVWADNRKEQSNIFAQRINAEGNPLWKNNGIELSAGLFRQDNPKIAFLSTTDWVVVWEDYRKGSSRLFAQKINSAGRQLWADDGLLVSGLGSDQGKSSLAVSANDNISVLFQSRQNGNFDIVRQVFSSSGAPLLGRNGEVVCDTPGAVVHQNAAAINNGNNELIIVWEDGRNGFLNIYAQKLTKAGSLAWGKEGVAIAKISATQASPRLIPDGQGGAITVWEDSRDGKVVSLYAQRISAGGRPLWGQTGISLTKLGSEQRAPVLVPDNNGGAICAWEDERSPLNLKDIFAQRISSAGEPLWGKNGQAVASENGDQLSPSAIVDGNGGVIISWADARRGDRNLDIYAQRLQSNGNHLWKENGMTVCDAPDLQQSPKLISDGAGGAIIAWTDKAGGSYDIYAQRINRLGFPLWMKDGVPVCQLARSQQNPLLTRMNDATMLVWQDYRFGNWDIFANTLSDNGELLWREEGMPIIDSPLTQFAPQAVTLANNTALVAWEDYRNGRSYEIYMQKVGPDGRPLWPINGLLIKTNNGARSPQVIGLDDYFVVLWEDYAGGGKALSAQAFIEE
ncbi:MAG: hypothetical protein ABIH56_00285 [Candidatus Margulisiibacteriota bacterium]